MHCHSLLDLGVSGRITQRQSLHKGIHTSLDRGLPFCAEWCGCAIDVLVELVEIVFWSDRYKLSDYQKIQSDSAFCRQT